MARRIVFYSIVGAVALLLAGRTATAAPLLLAAEDGNGGNGLYINLIVREVKVTPIVAHVGDPIRVEAVIENHAEWRGTITARVYANGKPVASRLFTYDVSNGPGRLYRETFVWNTAGVKPGQYRIRAEAFDWNDSSPFDNDMAVKEPVTLVPAGEAFPSGQAEGGEALAVDPRWHPDPWRSKETGARNSPSAPGIERETASGRTR